MPTEDINWIEELSELIQSLGHSFEIRPCNVEDFFLFDAEYEKDVSKLKPSDGWITGRDLMIRWRWFPEDLADTLPRLLPVYLWSKRSQKPQRVNDLIPSIADISEFQKDPDLWTNSLGKTRPNIWFSVPYYWLMELKNLEFLERLPRDSNRLLKRHHIPMDGPQMFFDWFTWDELLQRWHVSNHRLENLILDLGLTANWLTSRNGIEPAPEDIIQNQGMRGDWFPREQTVMFARQKVWDFEDKQGKGMDSSRKERSKELKINPEELRAVDLIEEARRTNPNMTTTEAVVYLRKREPNIFKKVYPTDRTIRGYLKGLPLNRAGGRPRKKTNNH